MAAYRRLRLGAASPPALGLLIALAAIALGPCGLTPEKLAPAARERGKAAGDQWSGRCVGVADGDTITVMRDGREVRVRLNAVDCPERAQAYGTVARQFTSQAVFGQTVKVRPTDIDQYGRTVADVRLPDGRSLNEALVGAGLAWWYRYYAPNDSRLQALEAEAKRARRGLWADRNPVPPWDFRKKAKAARQK